LSAKVVWLFIFVALYWAYCIFWGIKSALTAKTASDYFIAGRRLSMWVFVLAATATSFSGWTFMGHPGLIYRDGFQYAYASFYTITIPFTGVMFLKRQWMLGKRYGYVTPGEMLSDYFQGDAIRILTVIVALLFSIPYLGVQLGASGYLFNVLTDGMLTQQVGMWILSIVVLIYVASGGLRAVAYVDTLQCILLALGIVITGWIAYSLVGGWGELNAGIAKLATTAGTKWGTTKGLGGGDYSAYLAIPGVIQFTAGLGKQTPVGGLWTGVMVLSYMFALMGIQSAPAFSMWAFSNNNPRPFATQQVWASSFGIGLILFFFTAAQGMAAHLLGADPVANKAGVPQAIPAVKAWMAAHGGHLPLTEKIAAKPDALVPYYFNDIASATPWLVGLLAVCALAAMQSTGAAYMSTAGGMLTRDLYKRYLNPTASHGTQKFFGRLGVAFIVVAALLVATFSTDALVLLGGLAVAFGFQMWPSLAAVCWFPWITRQGATWGLAVGLIAVILTEPFGLKILGWFGIDPGWGRWPWTIHSAGWGMIFNLLVCIPISAMTQGDTAAREHRMKYHNFLREHATLSADKKKLVPLAWIITLAWLFFGIGPGAVLGNYVFGAPNAGTAGWTFGIPSIWAWQILFWALGVVMMWFLAFKMEMSTVPDKEITALAEDIGDMVTSPTQAGAGGAA
jgi:solute:Na+ symporter, SSS family